MHSLVEQYAENDWVYGIQKHRNLLQQSLYQKINSAKNNDNQCEDIVWTIDKVNNQIIFPSLAAKKIATNGKNTPEYLSKQVADFSEYLSRFEQQPELQQSLEKEDNFIRYLCKAGIRYILDDKNPGNKIHFLLDGIDLSRSLIENDNECYTASEIREIARNINHPAMPGKILFYRNGQLLGFEQFKSELQQLINEDQIKKIDLSNSPIEKTKPRSPKNVSDDSDDDSSPQGKNRRRRKPPKPKQSSLLGAGVPQTLKFDNVLTIADPVLDQLKNFQFNQQDIYASLYELNDILISLDNNTITNKINNKVWHKSQVKNIMLNIIKQFPQFPEQQLPLTEQYMVEQLTEDRHDYMLAITDFVDKNRAFEVASSSSNSPKEEEATESQPLVEKLKHLCKAVFNNDNNLQSRRALVFGSSKLGNNNSKKLLFGPADLANVVSKVKL